MQGSREGKASTVAGSAYGGEGVLGRGGPISFSREESFGFQRFLWQQCIKHDLRLRGGMVKASTRSGDSGKGNTVRAWEHYGGRTSFIIQPSHLACGLLESQCSMTVCCKEPLVVLLWLKEQLFTPDVLGYNDTMVETALPV